MPREIRKVAVLGAGVMGAGIAAHLANAGVESLLYDIVPKEGDRSALARKGIETARAARPAAFFVPELARHVTPLNFEDHADRLKEADWIVEVVVERMDVKQKVYAWVAQHRREGSVVSSNTSGLSLREMAAAMPDEMRRRFLVTHFFNPVRYMRLLEIVGHDDLDRDALATIVDFAERRLGKGVVFAKDTPNFIANRIGTYGLASVFRHMNGMTVEQVDAVFGPPMGRPKSAVFRTIDLVGLDVLAHTFETVHDGCPQDEERLAFVVPETVKTLMAAGRLGEKSGEGFYKKVKTADGKSDILVYDFATGAYRAKEKVRYASIGKARGIDEPAKSMKVLLSGDDDAGKLAWAVTADTLLYCARRIPEIADDVVNVDRAMRWGFAWELGPFESWDALGVAESVARMEAEGRTVPAWVKTMLGRGRSSFYERDARGVLTYWDPASQSARPVPTSPDRIALETVRAANGVIAYNASAHLLDLGDGVGCLEFHSKMNSLDDLILELYEQTLDRLDAGELVALVVGNQGGRAFSAGANVLGIAMAAMQKEWDAIESAVARLQRLAQRARYSRRPVVTAPYGLTLGGGAEVAMHGSATRAGGELYIGLVEVGMGLVPAGGGCKELLMRHAGAFPQDVAYDPNPFVQKVFERIGLAKVATSSEEARAWGFLRPTDAVTMDPDRLIADAKRTALALVASDFQPLAPRTARVPGRSGIAAIELFLYQMHEGGFATDHDLVVGKQLAHVLTGGDVPAGTIATEDRLLELEREAFLHLCGTEATLARIQNFLQTGKILKELAMREVVVVSAVRTAIGKGGKGALKDTRPDTMLAAVLAEAVKRSGLDPKKIDDVVVGTAMPEAEQGMNVARISSLMAGLPDSVPAVTINRFCSSGLQSLAQGAAAILAGWQNVVVSGGVESMSQIAMGGQKPSPNPELMDEHPEAYTPMGITAENVAERFHVSREDQDAFSYRSHKKAVDAIEHGRFVEEILPLDTRVFTDGTWQPVRFNRDEGPRPDTTIEKLAKLKPAFKSTGTVTAGSSSQVSDGAAAEVIAARDFAEANGLPILGVLKSYQVVGVPPEIMGVGPRYAIPKALEAAGLSIGDIDVFELNEAFASQALYCQRELGIPDDKLNPNGGAIALGHPLGCTGARMTATLLYELRRRKARYGVVSMCIGGGMGAAAVFENPAA